MAQYLCLASLLHKGQLLGLIPLGILAAAKYEAELLALRKCRCEVSDKCVGGVEGVVDADLSESLGVVELRASAAKSPKQEEALARYLAQN